MSESESPSGKTYTMGNVGAGAMAVQGDENQVIGNRLAALPDGAEIEKLFASLFEHLEKAELDDVTRDMAVEKTRAVAVGLTEASSDPGKLHRALLDAKAFLGSAVGWAWKELSAIIESDAVQKTIGTITEAGTRAAITAVTGAL
jgi:hypothetical protein